MRISSLLSAAALLGVLTIGAPAMAQDAPATSMDPAVTPTSATPVHKARMSGMMDKSMMGKPMMHHRKKMMHHRKMMMHHKKMMMHKKMM